MNDRKPWSSQGTRNRPPSWFKVKARANKQLPKRCAVCGATGNLHLDHIVGYAEGGQDELGNVQWLCEPHHDIKTEEEKLRGIERRVARRRRPVEKHPGLL